MNIQEIQVDGYGVWTGLRLDDLPTGATVIYGPNEAGKTTIMQFVRGMLYGFDAQERRHYLPPVHGGRAGGSLRVAAIGGALDIRRHVDDQTMPSGRVAVTAGDGMRQGQSFLTTLLSGVDESTFGNVYAVGLRELQELATLNDTDAADLLYGLASGLDRVSLIGVMRDLEGARGHLVGPVEERSQLRDLLERRETLARQMEAHQGSGRQWIRLGDQRSRIDRELHDLQRQIEQVQQERRLIEAAEVVRDLWQQRQDIQAELESMGPIAQLQPDALEKLHRLGERMSQGRRQRQKIVAERNELREEATALKVGRAAWRQAARIEALGEQRPWIASLQQQVSKLEQEAAVLRHELGGTSQTHIVESGPVDLMRLEVSPAVVNLHRAPAQEIRKQKRRLEESKTRMEATREEQSRGEIQISSALGTTHEGSLVTALEKAGELTAQLRQRIQVEERLEKLHRHRRELVEESEEWSDRQVLPGWALIGVGVVFAVGVLLMLTGVLGGVFSLSAGTSVSLGFLGIVLAASAVGSKFGLERYATIQLDECEDQLEALDQQLKKAEQQRDDLDAELPSSSGTLTSRLKTAESDLANLEELLPMQTQWESAHHKHQLAKAEASQAALDLKDARQRWTMALRSSGLPEELSPEDIKQLAGHWQELSGQRHRLTSKDEELDLRKQELVTLTERIDQLLEELEIPPVVEGPLARLSQLTSRLKQIEKAAAEREELRRRYKRLGRKGERLQQHLERLARMRSRLLDDADAHDEKALAELVERAKHAAALNEQHQVVSDEFNELLGEEYTEEDLREELEEGNAVSLGRKVRQLQSKVQELEDQRRPLHERLGGIEQQLKSLANDRQGELAELEMAAIEQEIAQAAHQWRLLATVGGLLEDVRRLYETDRQPVTLASASKYLTQFTEGKYRRVWTPLGDETLRVDDEHGRALPVAHLSTGTREQVFLSLRLALVQAFSQRGTRLPLVLDDVLVNFDTQRARAAARVLRDFASQGHQMFVFTCHEHVRDIFRSMSVEVRSLPDHVELAAGRGVVRRVEPAPVIELEEVVETPEVKIEPEVVQITLPPVPIIPEPEEEEEELFNEEQLDFAEGDYEEVEPYVARHFEEIELEEEEPEPEPEEEPEEEIVEELEEEEDPEFAWEEEGVYAEGTEHAILDLEPPVEAKEDAYYEEDQGKELRENQPTSLLTPPFREEVPAAPAFAEQPEEEAIYEEDELEEEDDEYEEEYYEDSEEEHSDDESEEEALEAEYEEELDSDEEDEYEDDEQEEEGEYDEDDEYDEEESEEEAAESEEEYDDEEYEEGEYDDEEYEDEEDGEEYEDDDESEYEYVDEEEDDEDCSEAA